MPLHDAAGSIPPDLDPDAHGARYRAQRRQLHRPEPTDPPMPDDDPDDPAPPDAPPDPDRLPGEPAPLPIGDPPPAQVPQSCATRVTGTGVPCRRIARISFRAPRGAASARIHPTRRRSILCARLRKPLDVLVTKPANFLPANYCPEF